MSHKQEKCNQHRDNTKGRTSEKSWFDSLHNQDLLLYSISHRLLLGAQPPAVFTDVRRSMSESDCSPRLGISGVIPPPHALEDIYCTANLSHTKHKLVKETIVIVICTQLSTSQQCSPIYTIHRRLKKAVKRTFTYILTNIVYYMKLYRELYIYNLKYTPGNRKTDQREHLYTGKKHYTK
jgi:hypothetical protein